MRARAGGRGPRAAADRGARAAVQPAVEVPGAGGVAQADRGGVPPAVGGPAARRRTTPPTWGRSPPGAARSWPRRASTTRCRCASARTGSPPAPPRRPARWPSWGDARRPASTRSPPRSTSRRRHPVADRDHAATRSAVVDALLARIEALAGRAALRGGGDGTRPARRGAPGHRADAAADRADPDRRVGRRPAAPTTGGWELAVVRHGRLAGAATSPPGAHPRPTLDLVRATAETVLPGPRPGTQRLGRGDRADPGLVGTTGHPTGRGFRRLGVTGSWRGTVPGPARQGRVARRPPRLSTERP